MNDFLTVKEAAESLNVTVQTIYNYLKELDKSYTKKQGGRTLISLDGVEEIKARLRPGNENAEEREKVDASVYLDYIETLKEQIRTKDAQIENLLDRQKEQNFINLRALESADIENIDEVVEEEAEIIVHADNEKVEEAAEKENPGLMKRLKYLFTGKLE